MDFRSLYSHLRSLTEKKVALYHVVQYHVVQYHVVQYHVVSSHADLKLRREITLKAFPF